MHHALWKLLRLRYRAALRKSLGGIKSWRGILTFGFGVLMLGFMLVPNLYLALVSVDTAQPAMLRKMAPLFLLAFTVMSLNSTTKLQAIHFWPAEVDFLFPGPFTRRELLLYKMAGNLLGAVFLALIFSMWLIRFSASWLAAFIGVFLAVWFVQLLQMCLVLTMQMLAERGWPLSRKIVLIVSVSVLAAAAIGGLWGQDVTNLRGFVEAARESWAGYLLLLPFEPFGRALGAESLFPELIIWGGCAAALNICLFLLIVRLDANYLEASVVGSQMIYQRIQRMRSGNLRMGVSRKTARLHLPQFPRCGGAGTIARRQLAKALRASPWVPLLIIGSGGGGLAIFVLQTDLPGLPEILTFCIVWCTFVFASLFPYDFRGDLEQMDLLKQLPFQPVAIAAGQLSVPIALVGAIQMAFLTVVAVTTGDLLTVSLAAGFAIPFNILLFGIENLTFLLYPVRMVAATPGDFQHFGRQMLLMMVKMLFLGVISAVAATCGFVVYFLCGESEAAFVIVAWLVLAAAAIGMLPAVAWAFRRFDVSTAEGL